MSEYEIEATSSLTRQIKIELRSDDGSRTLAAGRVGTTQNYGGISSGPPMLSLSIYYEAGDGTWQKIKAAVDQAFKLYAETFHDDY